MAQKYNSDNLIKPEDLTPEERRENARQMGIASGKARRKKKAMKETLEILLSLPLENGKNIDEEKIKNLAALDGKNVSVQTAILYAQILRALNGDTKAAEYVRDTSGNKLKEGIELSGEINNPFEGLTTDELKKLVNGE